MKKIVIAYHAYLYGDKYMEIMVDQFRKLLKFNMLPDENIDPSLFTSCSKLYIGIVDTPDKKPAHGIEWLNKFWSFSSSKKEDNIESKVEIVVYPENNEIRGTLEWIRDYAKNNPEDYILFFHSKGITRNTKPVEDWRHYMEYFTIENWRDCVAKLDEGYDCCGVLWNKDTPIGSWPHFSGAFYWAKASYINTLDNNYLISGWRYHLEFWIGSNLNVNQFEFHNSGLNDTASLEAHGGHYNVEYPRNKYMK